MRDRTIGILLGTLNVLLITGCSVLYMGKDRVAPRLTLEQVEYVYEEELPEHVLLEGVSAWDEQDGDVTDRVVIEKVVTDSGKKKAIITYGVADKTGNVKRASRTLEMPAGEGPRLPTAGEAGNVGAAPSEGEGTRAEVTQEAETEAAQVTETEAAQEAETEATQVTEAETAQEAAAGGNTLQTAEGENGEGRPSITFANRELRVKVGETPDWNSVMEEVQDDKDSREVLLGSLKIQGEYDLQKAGEYYLTLNVTDSDGNVSNDYPMKLIIEE